MKKILVVALVALVVLAGCNAGPAPENPNETVNGGDRNTEDQSNDGSDGSNQGKTENGSKSEKEGSSDGSSERGEDNRGDSDGKMENGDSSSEKQDGSTGDSEDNGGDSDGDNSENEQGEDTKNQSTYNILLEGDLRINHNKVYARVVSLFDEKTPPPERVISKNVKYLKGYSGILDIKRPFNEFMVDFEKKRDRDTGPIGLYSSDEVSIAKANKSDILLEGTLVHEYVHHLQYSRDGLNRGMYESLPDKFESGRIARGLIEGGAVYVTDQYIKKYLEGSRLQSERLAESYKRSNALGKYIRAPYRFGSRYIASRVDSAQEHWKVYSNPPQTTEQLLHLYKPGEEKPKEFNVSLNLSNLKEKKRERMGELFVRLSLTSELKESRAAKAAAGWGNDQLIPLENKSIGCKTDSDTRGCYVWSITWDDEKNATEFEKAFRDYLESRADKQGGVWMDEEGALGFERVNNKTVVILVGGKEFVSNLNVSGDGRSVEVAG